MLKSFFYFLLCLPLAVAFAAPSVKPSTFSMLCYLASQDDNWTYRDFGFSLSYKNAKGKLQTISAAAKNSLKNCSVKSASVQAAIPGGILTFHINDFTGEAGSTVECTNAIKYHFRVADVGKTCEFIVKSPKYGSYTSTDECTMQVVCGTAELSAKIPTVTPKK